MTDIRSLEQTLLENLPWNKARDRAQGTLLALYTVQVPSIFSLLPRPSPLRRRSSQTTNDCNASCASSRCLMPNSPSLSSECRYRRPYTLALDRTNWKVGVVDLNILMLSIVYRGIGVPVVWVGRQLRGFAHLAFKAFAQ